LIELKEPYILPVINHLTLKSLKHNVYKFLKYESKFYLENLILIIRYLHTFGDRSIVFNLYLD